nr:DUF1593 domain-containing protein [Cytophagales bacterium]
MRGLLVIFLIIIPLYYADAKPRVIVFTDINIGGGDPDDRQSLVHLLWYADELDIAGIIPYRWNKSSLEACRLAANAYAADFHAFGFGSKGYPNPEQVSQLFATSAEDARARFSAAIQSSSENDPLYVLAWGNMVLIAELMLEEIDLLPNIRLISIGTGLKYGPEDEVPGEACDVPNWNGGGRKRVYENEAFAGLWWLEINWTYNGMFSGNGPTEMFELLSTYGKMGDHIKFVTKDHDWAQYFRVGDTPSVLYLIDPRNNLDDPTQSSWAGKFKQPFPEERPNYFTDDNGQIQWDYQNPCRTWHNLVPMYAYNKSTLERERPEMYSSLLEKLQKTYTTPSPSQTP